MQISDLTFVGFLSLGGIRCLSYLPQILRIIRDENGASAISYTTWFTWILANLATALYAVFNLGDIYLAVVSIIYAFFCTVVMLLTVFKRVQHRNRMSLLSEEDNLRGGSRDRSAGKPDTLGRRARSSLNLNTRRFPDLPDALRQIDKRLLRRGLRA